MEIIVNAQCLSMEMRDFDNIMIVEVCIAGFEYS